MMYIPDIARHRRFFTGYAVSLMWVLFLHSVCFAAPYKVIHVIDANTIKAARSKGDVDIRLVGIESPELVKGPKQADMHHRLNPRLFLAKMVLNKIVDVRSYGYNIYNQMLAMVYVDGKNVNLEMVTAGMAVVKRDKAPPNLDLALFGRAEAEARDAKRGLWAIGEAYHRLAQREQGQEEKVTVYEFSDQKKPSEYDSLESTTVKRIDFKIDKTRETVFVYLENFAIAKAFDLNGKNPRIVIDILKISSWKGKRVIPVNGKLIHRIRTHLHKESEKMRIVLDLRIDASKDYSVTQLYDMKRHIYQLEISPAR